jgi:D-alanine transfer protein
MKTPHLFPALAALGIGAAILWGWWLHARHVEAQRVAALAGPAFVRCVPDRAALQREALRHDDLLPVYGSSELVTVDPYHASVLFREYPTGFTVFPIGQQAICSLLHVQKLATAGASLRGKKVVVSFTAETFFEHQTVKREWYDGNFSPVHAGELAFSLDLSREVKRDVARRMLVYPETLEQDPLLRFALEKLADDSTSSRLLYYAALPLGKLRNAIVGLQDHRQAVEFLRHPPADTSTAARHRPAELEWQTLLAEAERDYRRRSTSNSFGFADEPWKLWLGRHMSRYRNTDSDEEFFSRLEAAREWDDLDAVLRVLRELRAEPLILIVPPNASYLAYGGISPRALARFHERVRAVAKAHAVPIVDFAECENDKFFFSDQCHLSSRGWIYYARVLDAFYHGQRGEALTVAPIRDLNRAAYSGLLPSGELVGRR